MGKNWPLVLLLVAAFAGGVDVGARTRDARSKESPTKVGKIAKDLGEKVRADNEAYQRKQIASLAHLQPLAKALATSPALANAFLIDWLPSSQEGFTRVFGSVVAADEAAQVDIQRSRTLFASAWDSPNSTAQLDALFLRIRDKHSFVVVRGHNVNGEFRIPGSPPSLEAGGQRQAFSIKEIAERCREGGLFCVFLSCGASGHLPPGVGVLLGPRHEITIDDALALSALILRKVELLKEDLGDKPGQSLEQLHAFGLGISRAVNASIFGRLFVVVSEGVVVGLLLSDSAVECNDKDKCKPHILRYKEPRHRR